MNGVFSRLIGPSALISTGRLQQPLAAQRTGDGSVPQDKLQFAIAAATGPVAVGEYGKAATGTTAAGTDDAFGSRQGETSDEDDGREATLPSFTQGEAVYVRFDNPNLSWRGGPVLHPSLSGRLGPALVQPPDCQPR